MLLYRYGMACIGLFRYKARRHEAVTSHRRGSAKSMRRFSTVHWVIVYLQFISGENLNIAPTQMGHGRACRRSSTLFLFSCSCWAWPRDRGTIGAARHNSLLSLDHTEGFAPICLCDTATMAGMLMCFNWTRRTPAPCQARSRTLRSSAGQAPSRRTLDSLRAATWDARDSAPNSPRQDV